MPGNRRGVGVAAGVLLLTFAGAALVAPIMAYPFGRDQGAFSCVADVIARGGVPYRDAWEIKPPAIYYLFWASFALFGRSMLAPRLLDFLWTLAAAGVIVALGKRLLSLWAGIAGALFFLARYALGFDYWHTTQCDGFASLPVVAAAAVLLAAEKRRSTWLAAGSGVLIGVATVFKVTLAGFLAVALLAAALSKGEPLRSRMGRLSAYLIGSFAVVALVVALMWLAGALDDMTYILVTWNAKYAAMSSRMPLAIKIPVQTLRFLLGGSYPVLTLIGLLALIGTADLAVRSDSGHMRWLVPTWGLMMLLGVWVQDKYHAYHWLPVLPPLGLLAGQGLAAIATRLRRAAAPRAAQALTAAVLLLCVGFLAAGYWSHFSKPIRYTIGRLSRSEFLSEFVDRRLGDYSFPADLEVARFLRQRTEPHTPIFIWGFEPLVYFLADRPPASRFITVQPLVVPWSPPEWREELIADLNRNHPAYLLVLHNDIFPWVTASLADSAGQLAGYPELRELIERDYRPLRRIEDFDIWERR